MRKFHFTKRNRLSVFERFGGIDWSSIADFLDRWKSGAEGYITIHKEGKPKSLEQLGYYYGVILPQAFDAFKSSGEMDIALTFKDKEVKLPLTRESVDLFLKTNYGGWKGEYKDKGEMSMAECSAFEDWCILWLAKWMNCHIPPADPNWRER